jgi:hypothetical protein
MPRIACRLFYRTLLLFLLLSPLGESCLFQSPTAAAAEAAPVAGRLFEMRIYTTVSGKLENLHARFRNHTNALFVKHGMALLAYWTPENKPNTLIYVLAYPDLKSREASWEAFMADPEWQRVWAASKEAAGGPIVSKVDSTFMRPTDYSPIH